MTPAPSGLRSMWMRIPWSADQGIFLSATLEILVSPD